MIYTQLNNWTVSGAWPYTPIREKSMETGHQFIGVTGVIPAQVPGSIYQDLQNAGLIKDPYFELNSLDCEWVSNRWWVYNTAFTLPETLKNQRVFLNFAGINYKCRIFLNGEQVATHENMYTPCRIDISAMAKFDGENALQVILEHAPDEMSQIGHTSLTTTQKARFSYKWDFCTRLVDMGLWDKVTVEHDLGVRITSTANHWDEKTKTLIVAAEIDGAGEVEGVLSFAGKEIFCAKAEAENGTAMLAFPVEKPELWFPNGYGTQPLYDLKLTLKNEQGISDEKELRVGLKTVEYVRADGAIDSALPYCPVFNGVRIYIKGVNMTPLDHKMGIVTKEQYRHILMLAKEAHVNLIRVWGGGIIEKEEFYDLCDEMGLMVWQEFIQSSSGVDNIPSELPEFMEKLADTANWAVKTRRPHASLTFWSGGNELMWADGTPVDFTNKNIAMLKGIVNRLDPDRLMLPTSASGPTEWRDDEHIENNQDIHGPWKYAGIQGHYEMYNTSAIQLHSEFGCDGMSNPDAIRSVFAPENRTVVTMDNSLVWRHHGEWWDTYKDRDLELFGETPDLDLYCLISQFMQAEGIRYAIEANRRRAFRNVGSIVWQLNEPWPNVSCTCMVDFYGEPKLAYHFYAEAEKPLHVSMAYDSLAWKTGETFSGRVFVHDDLQEGFDKAKVSVKDESGKVIFEKEMAKAEDFTCTVPEGKAFTVTLSLLKAGKTVDENRYLFLIPEENGLLNREAVVKFVKGLGLDKAFTL